MTTLQDLTSGSGSTLDEFITEASEAFNRTSEANDRVIASHTALLGTGEGVVKNFNSISAELAEGFDSPTANSINLQSQKAIQDSSDQTMVDVLSNPNLTDGEKEQAWLAWKDQRESKEESRLTVAYESLANGQAYENDEAEEVFTGFDAIANIDRVYEIRNQKQALVNKAIASIDTNAKDVVIDLVEGVAPFIQQIQGGMVANQVLTELRGDDPAQQRANYAKALAFLGESKEEVRQFIENAPYEEQVAIVVKVIKAVTDAGGYSLTGENSAFIIQYLNDVVNSSPGLIHD